MTEKELVREIKILVLGKNPLSETWEDINGKIIDLLKANLKSLVEIDEKKLFNWIRDFDVNYTGDFFDREVGRKELDNFVESIAKANPIKLKEE